MVESSGLLSSQKLSEEPRRCAGQEKAQRAPTMAEDHDAGSVSVQLHSTQAVHATILVAVSNTNIEPQRRLAADGILGNPKAPPRNS